MLFRYPTDVDSKLVQQQKVTAQSP